MFELTLFCFHFAGGAARSYDGLKASAPAWLKVQPLDLPGHGTRRAEPVLASWEDVVADCLRQIDQGQAVHLAPFALFGHSMGAMVAREVAHAMASAGHPPIWLGLAGIERAPEADAEPDWLTCPDAVVVEHLRDLRGTPPELLENEALMQAVLPVLRADLALCAAYAAPARPKLSCPLLALGGTEDDISEDALQKWREETRGPFEARMVAGDHFFVTRSSAEVASIISDSIARTAMGSR